MTYGRFVWNFRMAKNGAWEVISNKNEKFLFGLFFGLVKKAEMTAFLVIFGPIFFIFGWKN